MCLLTVRENKKAAAVTSSIQDKWFFRAATGAIRGPHSEDAVRGLISDNVILRETEIWTSLDKDKVSAGTSARFAGCFPQRIILGPSDSPRTFRILPVYFLLDVSEHMSGEKLVEVDQGMRAFVSKLMEEPMAVETAYLSVITFGDTARQIVPPAPLSDFSSPALVPEGACCLGAALELLKEVIDKEVRKATSPMQKGDWTPFVFLVIGGCPTDSWQQAAESLKTVNPKPCIVAMTVDSDADVTVFKGITENVVRMDEYQPGYLGKYFRWTSQPIEWDDHQ
jgi:uncharacterized protein YegL